MNKRLTTHEPRHLRSNNDRKHEQPRLREHNGEEFSRIAGREGTIPATPRGDGVHACVTCENKKRKRKRERITRRTAR